MKCYAFQLTNDDSVCCFLVCLFYFCHKTTKIKLTKKVQINLDKEKFENQINSIKV